MIEKMRILKGSDPSDLFNAVVTLQEKINEIIGALPKADGVALDLGVMMERIGKLEGELDKAKQNTERLEKVVVRVIDQIEKHKHLPDGTAVIALG